jgi:dephospho-CoA kinase
MVSGPVESSLHNTMYQSKYRGEIPTFYIKNEILIETGQYKICDHVIIVGAPLDVRKHRCMVKRGMSEEDFMNKDKVQIEYSNISNFLMGKVECTHIWNSLELNKLNEKIYKIYNKFAK